MPVNWNGDAASQEITRRIWEGLQRATEFTRERLLDVLNVPNPYFVRKKRTRDTAAGKKGSSYLTYTRGAPKGGPPYKRTGNLQRNVAREYDRPGLRSRLGVRLNAAYGVHLELKGWPWLWATVQKFEREIAAQFILGSGGEDDEA